MDNTAVHERTNGVPPPRDSFHERMEQETRAVREQLDHFTRTTQSFLRWMEQHQQVGDEDVQKSRSSLQLLEMAHGFHGESLRIHADAEYRATNLRRAAAAEKGDATATVETVVSQAPWIGCLRGSSVAVGLLSDIHTSIRLSNQSSADTANNSSGPWTAPHTFVRETHKYWVNEDRLGEVMLSCASEVPLLVYGQKSEYLYGADATVDHEEDVWERCSTKVSSIYFDSPDLTFYHERLARSEGAQLLRVRWYGEQPQGVEHVFVELKTHHEPWVLDKSVKERVSIKECYMPLLLKQNGSPWNIEYAETIADDSIPQMSNEQLAEAADLLVRVRDLIIRRDLRPCVRTCYTRVSFQSSKSNALRLTLDRDLKLCDERNAPPGSWCLPKDSVNTENSASVAAPCAIFEVKLAGRDMPDSMDKLVQNGAIIDAHKFSKFLTGVAVFHADSPTLRVLPYWARVSTFRSLFESDQDTQTEDTSQATRDEFETKRLPPASRHAGFGVVWKDHLTSGRAGLQPCGPHSSRDVVRDIESGYRGPVIRRRPLKDSDKKKKKSLAPTKRSRIEPKSYFAAERTYIQWISAALLLVTVASVLNAMNVQTTRPTETIMMVLAALVTCYALVIYFRRLYLLENAKPYGYQDHAGPTVLTLAILVGIATILYFSVTQHRAKIAAPPSVVAQPGKCVQQQFSGVSMLEFQPSDIVLDTEKDMFLIPSITDVKALSRRRGPNEPPSVLETVGSVDRADIEALSFSADGTLFAVSEAPTSSVLLAFRPVGNEVDPVFDGDGVDPFVVADAPAEDSRPLKLVGEWKLNNVANSEGMVIIPGNESTGKPARLLVAGDATDPLRSNVYIFSVPTSFSLEGTRLHHISLLNSGLLSTGFAHAASAKISAMTEFEGLLFILHDNVRVIRGWDIESGGMVSEWITPPVGGEFDKQWEGLSIERENGSVILHMTLDTPPQVWSFYIEEQTTVDGQRPTYVFPKCAQTF